MTTLATVQCQAAEPSCRPRREQLATWLKSQHHKAIHSSTSSSGDELPEYTSDQVAQHDSPETRIWMSYGGFVYDVTDFISLHPGGTERISRAAGAAMEPFWFLHQQHFSTTEPWDILQKLVIGRLRETDQEKIDAQLEQLEDQMQGLRLELDFGSGNTATLSLDDLKQLPKTDRISKVGCPNSKNSPRPNLLFGGVLLKDLLQTYSSEVDVSAKLLVFHAMDGETAQVQIEDKDDILVAYEENGAPLTQKRGFPLRVILPKGRVVKWVVRIEVQ